jgi:uncharacterized protein involved in exopolysaccharide biosynthesis
MEQKYLSLDKQTEEDEINLIDYMKIIWNWRYLTLGTILIFSLFSGIYIIKMEPIYLAQVTILPTEKASVPNLGSFGGLASTFGFSLPVSFDPSAVYQDLLRSRSFLKEFVAVSFPTEDQPEGIPLKDIFKIATKDKDSLAIQLAARLKGMVEFKKVENVYVLSILARDPVFSAALANSMVEKLEVYNKENRTSKIKENRKFIEDRLVEMEKELKEAKQELSNFRKKNLRIDAERAPDLLDQQEWLMQEVKTKQEIYILLRKEYEMARIEEEKDKPYIQVLDNAIPPTASYKPAKKIIMMVSFTLSVLMGIFGSFVLNFICENKLIPAQGINLLEKIKR